LDHLQDIEFSAFMEDLAEAVDKFYLRPSVEASARATLASMAVGDELCHQGERLATLIHIDPQAEQGSVLTFEDAQHRRHNVQLETLPEDLTFSEYTRRFKHYAEQAAITPVEPLCCDTSRKNSSPKCWPRWPTTTTVTAIPG
jgi:hypothetical protein